MPALDRLSGATMGTIMIGDQVGALEFGEEDLEDGEIGIERMKERSWFVLRIGKDLEQVVYQRTKQS